MFVPKPVASVFHPANVLPVFAKEPEFVSVVTEAEAAYGLDASTGTVPEVLLLPLYVRD